MHSITLRSPTAVVSTLMPCLFHRLVESEVAHDGGDQRVLAEFPLLFQADGAQRQDAVTADHLAVGIGEDDAVGIAIERDPEVGIVAADQFAGVFRVERAAAAVDVEAVGFDAGGDDFGAEFLEDQRRDEIGGAVPAIDHDFEAVQRHVVGGVFGELDVAAARVVDPVGLADLRAAARASAPVRRRGCGAR